MERNPGDKFGPYEVVSPIGKGGMGEVWKATDTRLHRDVAIKFCGRQFSDRFLREARAIAALNHPNICTLYDIGPDYLVMEYIADAPSRGPLEASEAIRLTLGNTAAPEAAHGKGIRHRILKPANVLVSESGIKTPFLVCEPVLFRRSTVAARVSATPIDLADLRTGPPNVCGY